MRLARRTRRVQIGIAGTYLEAPEGRSPRLWGESGLLGVCAGEAGRGRIGAPCACPPGSMPSFGLRRHKVKGPSAPPPVPERIAPGEAADGGLRIAFLVYRGNPRCGGQGVYTRHLTRELVALGHSVEVFAGQPWPEVDDGVGFTPVPSLDLYREPDPFRIPHVREFANLHPTSIAALEFAVMCSAGFPEPWTFSLRVAPTARGTARRLRPRPRQPVPRQRHPRNDRRRLAVAHDPAPPDHRRPSTRAQPCLEPVAVPDPAAVVRLPAHAGEGGTRPPAGGDRVGVLEGGHRRADGCRGSLG